MMATDHMKFTCAFCGVTTDELPPVPREDGGGSFYTMQQHVATNHDIPFAELDNADNSSQQPRAGGVVDYFTPTGQHWAMRESPTGSVVAPPA